MRMIHLLTRPLLAALFVVGGIDVLLNPDPRAKLAAPVVEQVGRAASTVPLDPLNAVRANAVTHIVAGSMLGMSILPRLAALTLAASLLPTTWAGHRFWELEEPTQRAQQRTHFLKNVAILGGLLDAAFL